MPFWKKPLVETVLVYELQLLRETITKEMRSMATTIQEALNDLATAVQNEGAEITKAVAALKANPNDTAAIAAIEQAVSNLNQQTSDLASADGSTTAAPSTPSTTPSV